jgi:NAD(P)-dependent dehydrogenase (short-subunit alcohol dehydrogenase family)
MDYTARYIHTQLEDQVALVTGAGAGIGAAAAEELASRGARVVIDDIDGKAAEAMAVTLRERGGEAVAVDSDVSQAAGAEAAVAAALDSFGRLDLLVNNAAAASRLERFWETDPEDWERDLAFARGALHCTRAALPPMIAAGYGRIVNVTSITGSFGGPQMNVYGAANGAIQAFAAGLAKDVAEHGITVNCVAPGAVDTPRQRRRSAELRAEREAAVPLKRFASPTEIAAAIAYFTSPEAAYTTGEVLLIDGGLP